MLISSPGSSPINIKLKILNQFKNTFFEKYRTLFSKISKSIKFQIDFLFIIL